MPNPIVFALAVLGSQGVVQDLPKFKYNAALMPGQREIVLGPQLQYDVTMEVRIDREIPAQFTPSKIFGDSLEIYANGYVRWSVTDGTLFNTPCRVMKMDGITKGVNYTKTKQLAYTSRNTTTYWITTDGKLLRESIRITDPTEAKAAECVFWPDRIEVSVDDRKGRRSFAVYPKVDLKLVDMQFKPMIEDGKVVLSTKDYYVFDPFDQGFTKYTATLGGNFHGTFLATRFEGRHIDITGPRGKSVAYISKEDDLVKVDFPGNFYLVLDNLPRSRDPLYQKTGGAVSGGH